MTPPIRYSADFEDIQPGEAETIQDLNETFDTILDTTAKTTVMPCARCTPRRTRPCKAA